MKTVKKIVAAVLVSAMALSLAACGGSKVKKISADDFKSKLEKEGYTVMDGDSEEENVKTSLMAYDADMTVMLTYNEYTSKDAAKEMFDGFKDALEEAKKDGSVKKSSVSSSKITASDDDSYTVMLYAEDMMIVAVSFSGGDDAAKKVDDAIKALGV